MRKVFSVFCAVLIVLVNVPSIEAQDVNTEEALVWPQFVIGPFGSNSFDVEMTISNTDPESSWSGEVLVASQEFTLIDGIDVVVTDAGSGKVLSTQPLFTKPAELFLNPLQTVKLTLVASSLISTAVIGFLILNVLAGTNNQIVTSFAYNLRNGTGEVIDRIPVPPVQAGLLFQANMCRALGINTGFAVVALTATLVQLSVYMNTNSSSGERKLLETSEPFQVFGQRAFFPNDVIAGLPTDIPGAYVEVRSLGDPIWVTALDVVAPPVSTEVQIAGKQVKRAVPAGASSVKQ